MKSKTLDIILFLLVILIIAIYFSISHLVYNRYNIVDQIEYTESFIKEERWDEAIKGSREVHKNWNKIRFMIMINYGESDIPTIEEYINRFIGETKSKNKEYALSDAMYIRALWNNMHKLVPGP